MASGGNGIWKFSNEGYLKDYTLVIPSVAVGNVGQLACDLLISSLNMKKIGSVYSPAQIPVIGCNPYDLTSGTISTSCEIYESQIKKLCVLQLRSPIIFKYAKVFLEEVVKMFMEKNIKDIIILTSSFAHEKKHILSSPFRYVGNEENCYMEMIKAANLVKHENDDGEIRIFGGGFASLLYKICVSKQIPALILFKYCSEGDNIPDAYDMVKCLVNFLPIFNYEKDISSQLVQPVSWTLLFGRPPPQEIY